MPEHRSINGLDLSESYFHEVVKPLMSRLPRTLYSAGLFGDGSEVLGFDTEMSQDHNWGPRVLVFLHESEQAKFGRQIASIVHKALPKTFRGFATQFTTPNQIVEIRADHKATTDTETPATRHSVEFLTIQKFFSQHLNFSFAKQIEPADWLTFPEQKLATIVGGRVFEDQIGLQEARDMFTYYPKDVWLYLLACQWTRIEQEEHLMGRAGFAGDELGSAIIAGRLVRDLMRLCFLMEKKYAPYPKWFGTAFSRLKSAETLAPLFRQILASTNWEDRQRLFSPAYESVARSHNALQITESLPTSVRQFHDRPFFVISMGDFSRAILSQIQDPAVRTIADKRPIGSIDQFSDNTDLLSDASWRSTLRTLYI